MSDFLTVISVICKQQNDRATYSSLDARSNALARGLESVGVQTGDRVGVMLGNSMEHAVVCCQPVKVFLRYLVITKSLAGNLCTLQAGCDPGR